VIPRRARRGAAACRSAGGRRRPGPFWSRRPLPPTRPPASPSLPNRPARPVRPPAGTPRPGSPAPARRRRELVTWLVAALLALVFGLAVTVWLAGAAHAAPPPPPPAPAPAPTAPNLDTVLTNARNWLMGILAAAGTFFFSLGAARYMGANGDPAEIERAKAAFRNCAIGYGLAVLAPLVLQALRSVVTA